MAKFTATKTKTGVLSITNSNGHSITHNNKTSFAISDINRLLKTYVGNDPLGYLKRLEDEKMQSLLD